MGDLIKLLKLPPPVLAAVALGTGLVLFAPLNYLEKLGLANISELWTTILGLSFIVSSSLLAVYFTIKISNCIRLRLAWIRFKKGFPKVMKGLRSEELIVVALLYRSPNYTTRLPHTDGVTIRLQSKMVIQLTSRSSIAYGDDLLTPFTITPIAQDYIDKHPELIQDFDLAQLRNLYQQYNNHLLW